MKKKTFINILTIILLSAGVLLLFYPAINNIIFVYNQNQVIDRYNDRVIDLDSQVVESMKNDAKEYNEKLSKNVSEDEVVLEQDSDGEAVSGNLAYSQLLSLNNEQIGYIVIEKIGLNQPIFHGTDDSTLDVGIGHMENTSLPVGGINTHCVLTGHTGVPGMMLFTDLHKMEKGDCFYIKVLDEVLKYEVDDINVILPSETEYFKIQQGRDIVTLVTCTPYGVNTHRLLVTGSRVPYNGEIDVNVESVVEVDSDTDIETKKPSAGVQDTKKAKITTRFVLLYIVTPTVICTIIILLIVFKKKKKRKLAEIQNENLSGENEE